MAQELIEFLFIQLSLYLFIVFSQILNILHLYIVPTEIHIMLEVALLVLAVCENQLNCSFYIAYKGPEGGV